MKKFFILTSIFLCGIVHCFSQAGGFDQSFADQGKLITNIQELDKGTEAFYAVAVQPDGKIVAAGRTLFPGIVCRYNANGTLDNSFAHKGMFFAYGYKFNAIILQPDGRIIGAGDGFMMRLTADGRMDNSFDADGIISGLPVSSPITLALQTDGKILVAGGTTVARFNSNGSADNSFEGDGQAAVSFASGTSIVGGLAIQSNGKIVVTGSLYNSTNQFGAARFNADGTPDISFNGNGKTTTSFGTPDDYGYAAAIQPDGKILVAGYSNHNVALVRYNSNGTLDNSFDTDGKLVTITGSNNNPPAMAIQPDGKFIVVTGAASDFLALRYNPDGTPDNSFDGDGRVSTDINGNNSATDRGLGLALLSNGKFVIAGFTETVGGSDFAVACYNADGTPDNSFDNDGRLSGTFGTSYDIGSAIAIQNDGKILAAGFTSTADLGSITDFAVTRYLPNGNPDNGFDGDGKVTTSIGASADKANAMAIQSNGKIVVGGFTTAADYDFALVRYNSDGSPDNSFDGDGKVTTTVGARADIINCIAIQPDGKIIAAGSLRTSQNTDYDFAIVRYNINGSLDNTFDGDGILTMGFTATGPESINAVAVQADGKIIIAGYSGNDFAIVRLNSNGSLDNTFDGDGKLTIDFNGGDDEIGSMAIQPDGKIVLAGRTGSNFALARLNTNGSLDNSFDGDGKIVVPSGRATCVAIQDDGKILVGGVNFTLLRFDPDGSPDASFDGDGRLDLDMGMGTSPRLYSMKLFANRIYLAGTARTAGADDFLVTALVNDALFASLPLQLRDFSGKRVSGDAWLSWKTEHESNMLGYTVERSIDGRTYKPIGTVMAENKAEVTSYSLIDPAIATLNVPVVYYRLKEKSTDGKFAYSQIIALPQDKSRNIALVYPNPVVNEVNIAMAISRREKLQIRITDNNGRLVKQQPWDVVSGSMSLSIDVSDLSAGMYYLEIKGESISYKKQFIK